MTTGWQEQLRSPRALQKIVQQASAALVCMDCSRLEELAKCCADLNRDLQQEEQAGRSRVPDKEFRDAAHEIQLLGRILYETRANLMVFSRLHLMRQRDVAAIPNPYGGDTGTAALNRLAVPEKEVGYGDN